MKRINDYIRDHLYEICGLYKIQPLDKCIRDQCEWSQKFMAFMINRITVGRYRYGRKDAPVRKRFKYLDSIQQRLKKYRQSGNLEHLVDIANLCMLEFECGEHPNRHFKAIDDGAHVEGIESTGDLKP